VKFLMIFMLIENPIFSQSLKNIKIGEKYSGPQTIETTVGGYQGTLTISTLKDKTVYSLDFISKEAFLGRGYVQLIHIKVDQFFENIQSNYNITFDRTTWKHEELLTGNWTDMASCEKEGIIYIIASQISLKDKESKITFSLYSRELVAKGRKEDDKDF